MIFPITISIILVSLHQATTVWATSFNGFINPPDNSTGSLNFHNGTNVTLEWSTSSRLFDINIVGIVSGSNGLKGNTITLLEDANNRTDIQWLINVDDFNLKGSVVYHAELIIRDSDNRIAQNIDSRNFSISSISSHTGPKMTALVVVAIGIIGTIFL